MTDSMKHACAKRTLCEVFREIADVHQDRQSEHDRMVRKKLAECEAMAKRMTVKLKEYNKHYDADWWEKNPDYEQDLELRLSKKYIAEF